MCPHPADYISIFIRPALHTHTSCLVASTIDCMCVCVLPIQTRSKAGNELESRLFVEMCLSTVISWKMRKHTRKTFSSALPIFPFRETERRAAAGYNQRRGNGIERACASLVGPINFSCQTGDSSRVSFHFL